jgi:hypothetical protein
MVGASGAAPAADVAACEKRSGPGRKPLVRVGTSETDVDVQPGFEVRVPAAELPSAASFVNCTEPKSGS